MYNGKPIICFTCDTVPEEEKTGRTFETPKSYSAAFAAAGGIPVLAAEFCPKEIAEFADAVVFTGGFDVQTRYFGEEVLSDTVKTDPVRDEFEMELIQRCIDLRKPMIGVCRGIQIINIALGGDIYQDLPEQAGFMHYNPRMRHPVFTEPDTVLRELFGETFNVNSTHHQAVRKLGDGVRVMARSIEGITEAICHETLPIYATQFHPERMTGYLYDGRTQDFAPLLKFYVDKIKECAAKA